MAQKIKKESKKFERTCKFCGKRFLTNDSRINYCCERCRKQGRQEYMHDYYKRRYTLEKEYCETRKSDSRRFYAKRRNCLKNRFYENTAYEIVELLLPQLSDEERSEQAIVIREFLEEKVRPIRLLPEPESEQEPEQESEQEPELESEPEQE